MDITKKQLEEEAVEIKKRVADAIKKLALTDKESELDLLEEESQGPSFWEDSELAAKTMQKINNIKEVVVPWRKIEKDTADILEILNEVKEEDKILNDLNDSLARIKKELQEREIDTYFSGKYDDNNAILSIYAGAGGVDAQDWAEMLLSMYLKYAEKRGLKAKIVGLSSGQEAGIKSVTVEIEGVRAYGLLKSEGGVHRLVRISPYDADKARHTSFALVEVIPEIEPKDLTIDEKDLKIDTYRASGHGGQSVNTTDSAVRITHLPTGITVTCQNERSQLQNKEQALKILKARIATEKGAEKEKELKIIKGENLSAEWGSQIRSYVLHPYTMVKDHRTGEETANTEKVLLGEIQPFIDAYLKS
ncbi:MAG: peptide chain release factor 2 [Patescibacteria group bacterium]|nr:peptide chain release factor 2 [Patescibacteria group bacterium]